MTRVSAKYIRKLAAQYGITISEPLRSKAVKAKYVELIADAILTEQSRLASKEKVQQFVNDVTDALNPRYYVLTDLDSFARKCSIFYVPEKRVIGQVSLKLIGDGVAYRFPTDSIMVKRHAESVEDAVNTLIDSHLASLKSSII